MATTTSVTVTSANWTLLSTAINGTIENQTGESILLNFAASLPSSSVTVGHVLESTESVQYNVDVGNVYGRIQAIPVITGPVIVTV